MRENKNRHMVSAQDIEAYFSGKAGPEQLRRIHRWMKTVEGQAYLSAEMDRDIGLIGAGGTRLDVPSGVPSVKMLRGINTALKRKRIIRNAGIAAAVMIPFLFINLFITVRAFGPGDRNIAYETIHVPAGEQLRVILSDGTAIMLNSESTLEYPLRFHRKHRTVRVSGEAYFEVAKNKRHPFSVETPEVTVNVLGTKFNVNTAWQADITSVYLDEGSVVLRENVSGNAHTYKMKPGQLAQIQKSSGRCYMDTAEEDRTLGWLHKRYYFKDAPLADVVRLLEKSYGVMINISTPYLYGYTYTMNFANETIDEILLQMEAITPIRCVNSNGNITIYPK